MAEITDPIVHSNVPNVPSVLFDHEVPDAKYPPVYRPVRVDAPYVMPTAEQLQAVDHAVRALDKQNASIETNQNLLDGIKSANSISRVLESLVRLEEQVSGGSELDIVPTDVIAQIKQCEELSKNGVLGNEYVQAIQQLPTAHVIQQRVADLLLLDRQKALRPMSTEAAIPDHERKLRLPRLSDVATLFKRLMRANRA